MEQLQGNGNNIKSVVKKVWILFFFFYPFARTLSDLCVLRVYKRERSSFFHWSFGILACMEGLKLNLLFEISMLHELKKVWRS